MQSQSSIPYKVRVLKLQKNSFPECDNSLTIANHEESNNQKLLHRRARVDLMPLNDLAAWAIRVNFLPGLEQPLLYIPLHFLTYNPCFFHSSLSLSLLHFKHTNNLTTLNPHELRVSAPSHFTFSKESLCIHHSNMWNYYLRLKDSTANNCMNWARSNFCTEPSQ